MLDRDLLEAARLFLHGQAPAPTSDMPEALFNGAALLQANPHLEVLWNTPEYQCALAEHLAEIIAPISITVPEFWHLT